MNQYIDYNLSIKKDEYFSFFKGKNKAIFNTCKTIKYKYKQNIKYHSTNPSHCRRDLIITKDISFNYITKSSDKTNNSLNKNGNNNLKNAKNKNLCKLKSKKYFKQLVNKLMNNNNTLIEPIMYFL